MTRKKNTAIATSAIERKPASTKPGQAGGAPRRGRPPKSDTEATWSRKQILDAALDYVGKHGLGDLSLRGFAASIGTTHRNLSYHFGSKDVFLAALVDEIETRFSAVLDNYSATGLSPADSIRRMWAEVSQPANLVYGKLAFEATTENLLGRGMGLFQEIDKHWLAALTKVSLNAGRSPTEAAIEGRLSVSVLRGAWMDLLTHEDHDAVKRMWDVYLARFETAAGTRSVTPRKRFAQRQATLKQS